MSSRILQPPRSLDPGYRVAENRADIEQRLSVLERGVVVPAHAVGATGEPAFQTSYANYSSAYSGCRFFKTNGRVYIEGLVFSSSASGGGGATVFTLPSECWPQHDHIFVVIGNNSAGNVNVQANGAVKNYSLNGYAAGATSNGAYYLSLSGINFALG